MAEPKRHRFGKSSTRQGKLQLLSVPIKQDKAYLMLQVRNVSANGRLRHPNFLGTTSQIAMARR
jgi:hypothetical protein